MHEFLPNRQISLLFLPRGECPGTTVAVKLMRLQRDRDLNLTYNLLPNDLLAARPNRVSDQDDSPYHPPLRILLGF